MGRATAVSLENRSVAVLGGVPFVAAGNVAFGGDPVPGVTLLSFDGQEWRGPDVALTAAGVGGSGPLDVWLAGEGGAVRHLDGTGEVVRDAPTAVDFRFVTSTGPDQAVAVGDQGDVWRFDAGTWTELSPAETDMGTLVAGGFATIDELWAIDDGGDVFLWDGVSWSRPSLPRATHITVLASGDLWLADGSSVRHVVGGVVAQTFSPGIRIDGFTATATEVWVAEERGAVARLVDGVFVTQAGVPQLEAPFLFGAGDDVWLLAQERQTNRATVLRLHCGVLAPFPELVDVAAVGRTPQGDVLALDGARGLWRRSGGRWRPLAPPVGTSRGRVRGAAFYGPHDVWALDGASPVRWDGVRWTGPSGIGATLGGFTAAPDGTAWVVGAAGAVLRHDP